MFVFTKGNTGKATAEAVWQVFREFQDHPNAYFSYSNADISLPENQDFARQLKVTTAPTIVFVKWTDAYGTQFVTVTRIVGHSNYAQIKRVFEDVLAGKYTREGEPDSTGVPYPIPGEGDEYNPGLSPFGGGSLKLGLFALIVLAIIFSSKQTNS